MRKTQKHIVLFLKLLLIVWCVWLMSQAVSAQTLPAVNDGQPHGDPPFRLEEGWIPLLNGKNLNGWHGEDRQNNEWFAAPGVYWNPTKTPERLLAIPGSGDTILNGTRGNTTHLITDQKFGDLELYAEFLIPQKGNSGIYFGSLYKVQIFDSYGVERPLEWEDCGAIPTRGDKERFHGSPPLKNASRKAGEWQTYQIWFQAPRFDAAGKKVQNAKFLRVLLNGIVVQENVEVDGPTWAHLNIPEAATNPIMLQGDHGGVAYRNIYVRPLRPMVKPTENPER